MIARLQPGPGTAIVGPDIAVLVAAPPSHPVVGSLCGPVLAGSEMVAIVDELAKHGVAALPGIGCYERRGDSHRLLLRTGVTAEVSGSDDRTNSYDATGHRTWLEVNLPHSESVTLALDGSWAAAGSANAEQMIPPDEIELGVLPAGLLMVAADAISESGHAVEDGSAVKSAAQASESSVDGTHAGGDQNEESNQDPGLLPPDGSDPDDELPDLDYEHLFEGTVYNVPESVPATSPAPDSVADVPPSSGQVNPIDPMTGVFEEIESHAPESAPSAPQPPPPTSNPTVLPPAGGADLIDWVPGMGLPAQPLTADPSGPGPLPPASSVPQAQKNLIPPVPPPTNSVATTADPVDTGGGLDSPNTFRQSGPTGPGVSPGSGPMVTAVHCPAGHPNPSHLDRCRICSGEIRDRSASLIARPSLGRFKFDDGQVYELHRHLLVGRNPSADLRVNDEPTDRVTLASPDNIISRTHLTVELDGWQVKVTDRDSMNHTFVEIPGRKPFQLRPGEAYPIPPGAAVRLGDDLGFTYET